MTSDHPEFLCLDCDCDTLHDEYYMVHDTIWHKVNPKGDGMLCIGCLEKRLGRKLTPLDFMDVPVNKPMFGPFAKRSDRLKKRLGEK